jgi:hypothetical protein
LRKSSWFIEKTNIGKISIGNEATATFHLLDDADLANTRFYSDPESAGAEMADLALVVGGVRQSVTWSNILQGFNNNTVGQNGRRNIVRYDSPTLAGFAAAAAWGEDDMWDAALTYKGVHGNFNVSARVGYGESSDATTSGTCTVFPGTVSSRDCSWWGAAASVMHNPTGLYLYGAYGEQTDDNVQAVAGHGTALKDNEMWFVQAGIEREWFSIGKTTLFGEYRFDDGGTPEVTRRLAGAAAGTAGDIRESTIDFVAAGVVQNLAHAAMDIYVIYRHTDGDVTTFGGTKTELDGFDMIMSGARIVF